MPQPVSPTARLVPVVSGAAQLPPSPAPARDRHLVLAYTPRWQSLDDLATIARHVVDIDPGIRPFIVPVTLPNSVTRRAAAARPTLVVSPGPLLRFRPRRGKVYHGWPVPKFEELRRLREAGVPVPRTALLTPDLRLDPAEWGDLVILKPTDIPTSSHGAGINLIRTRRVRYRPPAEYPPGHPGRLGPMMVQQYVDTGAVLSSHRVLTFFGEPLCAYRVLTEMPRVDPAAPDEVIESAVVAIQASPRRQRILQKEPDVIALARRAHAALPEIPLKGCDVLREAATGRLYVIELNSGGNTWQFSSGFTERIRRLDGPDFVRRLRQQFDAMRTAARVLVARTRSEAA
jgi:hypothetical protein